MLGSNPVLPVLKTDGATLWVHSIFHTIQGEGPFSGCPAVFIRLAGCNLRCTFCDTDFDMEKAELLTVEDIVSRASFYSERLIVITGGEPLRQEISPLVYKLVQDGHNVQLETAGTVWRNCLLYESVTIVVSPKTPRLEVQIEAALSCGSFEDSCLKYVIKASDEFSENSIPVAATQPGAKPKRLWAPQQLRVPIFITPCDEQDPEKNLLNIRKVAEISMKHGYVAQVQLHKILGLP